jgi:NADPH-dependent 2,4-dienoyl-CoA reductase/sulfur reductase-like enzyme
MTSATPMLSMTEIGPTVTVIGAGPAGLAAAVEAATAGIRVTVIDAGARPGGQYWRHGPAGLDADLHHDIALFTDLHTRFQRLITTGKITYLPGHQVWTLTTTADEATVHAIDPRDVAQPVEVTVTSDYLVLAVGAYDRQLPFPGWDLPGVMTVGAAQSLLKGSGVVVGPRVLVAGTGPFLLPVAAGLAVRGSRVVGVYEANDPIKWLGQLPALLGQSRKIREAAGYLLALARHRIRVRHRSIVVAAHGSLRLEAVTVARLDRSGAIKGSIRIRIPVDVLAVGYGFTAQSELPLLAGCEMHATDDQTLSVIVDDQQATSNTRVFAAGETTGIGGAQLAVAEGTLAGAAVAHVVGRSVDGQARRLDELAMQRDQLRRFAVALHAVYPVPSTWTDIVEADTVVCRCEEVTVAEISEAVALGARDLRSVKLLSRAGMGWCQGRECAYATACLIAQQVGTPLDLGSGAGRPVATPIPLGLLAATYPEPAETDQQQLN